jgi:hypothetical protein
MSIKTTARKLAQSLIGTAFTTPKDGTGTVTAVTASKGVIWIHVTVKGAGFNGSDLKTAVRHTA